MTTTAADLRSVVDALVGEPVDALDAPALQARIVALTPQLARCRAGCSSPPVSWPQVTGGTLPSEHAGARSRPRSVPGWLADVQHSTPGAAGSQLRTARLLRQLPVVVAAVLDGRLTPAQAAVLTRLVGRIDQAALLEAQPAMVEARRSDGPRPARAVWVAHQLATHCEPVFDDQQDRARDRRFLSSRREADGSLRGSFLLPAQDSEALLTALEPLARRPASTTVAPPASAAPTP